MEEEMNYLSEKIEELDKAIETSNSNIFFANSKMGSSVYKEDLLLAKKEKQILENILSTLTIAELS